MLSTRPEQTTQAPQEVDVVAVDLRRTLVRGLSGVEIVQQVPRVAELDVRLDGLGLERRRARECRRRFVEALLLHQHEAEMVVRDGPALVLRQDLTQMLFRSHDVAVLIRREAEEVPRRRVVRLVHFTPRIHSNAASTIGAGTVCGPSNSR